MLIVRILRPSTCIMFLLAFTLMAVVCNPSAAQVQSNVTVMTYGPGHGTQVEYLGSNGMSYLWYPGNRVVLPAPWKVKNGQICYRYGKRTYNPITKSKGGNWECRPVAASRKFVVDTAKGDIFGLSKRKSVPFVLSKARTTLSKLGKGPAGSTRFKKPKKIDRTSNRDIQRLKASCPSASELMAGGRLTYIVAGGIYFWGGVRTKKLGYRPNGCARVDYAKAFSLFRLSGDFRLFKEMVKLLKDKAKSGDAKAIAALRKVNLSPPG